MIKKVLNGSWLLQEVCAPEEAATLTVSGASGQIPAAVPGDVHKDLQNAGRIPDPYYSDNVNQCQWVADKNWCYLKEFTLDSTELETVSNLVFYGLDTFADVYVNGHFAGSCASMFVKHVLPVGQFLREGKNLLCVVMKSITREMERLPHEGYNSCFNHERLFIRKAACHFSWDWAPNLLATGIFDDVTLENSEEQQFGSIHFRTENNGDAAVFFEFADIPMIYEADTKVRLTIFRDGFRQEHMITGLKHIKQYLFHIDNPQLWWPAGYGAQPLYQYKAELLKGDRVLDVKEGHFAIRTVCYEETHRTDGRGLRFLMKVNGVPVPLKGANWVPADIFIGSLTKEHYTRLLETFVEGNLNTLRVWGGGFYEKEWFYDECDRLGILIWQDFMFSCAELPDDYPGFYDVVVPELEYQVKRLRNHPCILVWSGGNEHPGGIDKVPCLGKDKFDYLFRGIATHLDRTRPYVENSPWGYEEPGNCMNSGDTHLSSMTELIYDGNIRNFRRIVAGLTGSAMTEMCHMGSSPIDNVMKYIPEDQLWPTNETWDLHVRCNPYDPTGQTFLDQQKWLAEEHFGKLEGLYDFVKKSEATQAEHIKADVEFHRSRFPDCAATMVWMYNDTWPCGSWSVLDYYMTKKSGFYALQRSSQPVLPIMTYHQEGYRVFVVNDTVKACRGSLRIAQYRLDGKLIKEQVMDFTAAPSVSSLASKLEGFEVEQPETMFFVSFTPEDGKALYNSFIAHPFKELHFTDPSLEICGLEKAQDGYLLRLRSKACARFVNVSVKGGEAQENYFDMQPDTEYEIPIRAERPISEQDIVVRTFLDEWKPLHF